MKKSMQHSNKLDNALPEKDNYSVNQPLNHDYLFHSPEKKPPLYRQNKYQLKPLNQASSVVVLDSQLYANFKEGDLLYGLQPIRAHYLPCLKQKVTQGVPVTIDQINQEVVINETQDAKSLIAEQYLAYWQTTKYFTVKENPLKGDEEAIRLRNSCKAALAWPHRTIHFCLDGIELEPYVTAKYNRELGIIDHRFTVAECRFLYRHRNDLINPVIFYRKGQACPAPWQEKSDFWQNNYQAKPAQQLDLLTKRYPNLKFANRDDNRQGLLGKRKIRLFSERFDNVTVKTSTSSEAEEELINKAANYAMN